MTTDSDPTIALPGVAEPPPLPPPPVPPPQRLRALNLGPALSFVAIGFCLGLAALWQMAGLDWTASAATWLDRSAHHGPLAEDGLVALAWHHAARLGLNLAQAISLWQFLTAGTLLAALLLVAWRLRGPVAGLLALGLLLLWPTSRALVVTVGAETPLAALLLLQILAGLLAWPRPLLSAILLGTSLALLILVHPLGLPLAVASLLAVLVLPLRRGVEPLPGVEPRAGLWPHPVVVPQLAGLALGAGLLAAALGPGGFKTHWLHLLGEWRAPVVTPWLGGLANLPVLGTFVALVGQMPVPLLVLAISAIVGAVRRPKDFTALPAGVLVACVIALCWIGLPAPGLIDGVALLAPGIVLLAVVMIVDVARELWARGNAGARTAGVVLALATLLAFLADVQIGERDRRNLIAHIPGVMTTTAGIQPAILHADDLGLLARQPQPTSILPSHPGGDALANALRRLHPVLAGVSFGAPFSADRVLVSRAPPPSVDEMWTHLGKPEGCSASARTCLYGIRVKPQ